jgi:hypothetical protein
VKQALSVEKWNITMNLLKHTFDANILDPIAALMDSVQIFHEPCMTYYIRDVN